MFLFIIFTDDDLILFKNRDPQLLEKVFKEYNEQVFNYLVIKANGNTNLAEELFSDTFHSAIISAPKVSNMNKIYPWLLKIANRRFLDYLRLKYKKEKHETESEMDDANIVDENHSVNLLENEKVLMIRDALEKMRPEYKQLLTLKYIENKTQKEISDVLNKTESSIESLLFRAREALKKELHRTKKAFL
jgi:RNA polymerase sigma factor (sigma-70 family)